VSAPSQEGVAYLIEETPSGTWRRFRYPTGEVFAEYTSRRRLFGLPFYHRTQGRSPETGKPVTACGVIAIGQFARGLLAIGQVARGIVAIGQIAVGVVAVGQGTVGVLFGLGQCTTGYVAIGQTAYGWYALGMEGHGQYVWDMNGAAPEAEAFFRSLLP
jgi:hypothetical protein